MELQQLKSGDKVKLKLIQPQFKCSGREEVTCFYRGTVVDTPNNYQIFIKFKYKGKSTENLYDLFQNSFINDELKDIKIVK